MIRWKVVFSYFSKYCACAVHHTTTPHDNKMEWKDRKKIINYILIKYERIHCLESWVYRFFLVFTIVSHFPNYKLMWCFKTQTKNIYKKCVVMKVLTLTRETTRMCIVCEHKMLLLFRNCVQSYRYQCCNLGWDLDHEAICRMYLSCL